MPETGKAKPYEAAGPMETRTPTSLGSENLKAPSLLAWLASLATVSAMLANLFLPRGDNPYLRGAGVVALVLAGGSIFAPFFLLMKHGRIEDSTTYMQTRDFVDRGLYTIIRHPQYLGYMLLAWGFALLSQHWAAVLPAVVGTASFYLQAVREERYCLARFGEPYQQYLQQVPRFNAVIGLVRLLPGSKVLGR